MLTKNAIKLLERFGKVQQFGLWQYETTVNGRRVGFVAWDGGRRVGRVFVDEAAGANIVTLYTGPSLRDGLRWALHTKRTEDVEVRGVSIQLTAEITHRGLKLTPEACFYFDQGPFVSTLGEQGVVWAQQFIAGEIPAGVLLDWLQEQRDYVEDFIVSIIEGKE